jgi:hypothetical protein
MKKLFAAFGLLLALSACETEQAPPPAHSAHTLPPKISLDVQAINLADRSGLQPNSSPYNTDRFTPTISEAIRQWASDRLQAAGQSGQAIIVIKDASLIQQPLPVSHGIDGWFTRQQGVKYIARAEVSLEANGRPGFALTDAVATRAVTLPEDPTPVEKQDAYFSLLNGLMKDLGQNMETGIQTHMGGFIVTPQVYGVTAVPTGNDVYAGGPATDGEAPVIIQSPTPPQMQMGYAPQDNMQANMGMQQQQQTYGGYQQANQTQSYGSQQGILPVTPNYYGPEAGQQGYGNQMSTAVANATIPSPPSVAVSPSTTMISQSSGMQQQQSYYPQQQQASYAPQPGYNTGFSYGAPQNAMSQMAPVQASNAPVSLYSPQPQYQAQSSAVTAMPLPPPPTPQQIQSEMRPQYGANTVPTVPDLASQPSSFAAQPTGYLRSYNSSNSYNGMNAPQMAAQQAPMYIQQQPQQSVYVAPQGMSQSAPSYAQQPQQQPNPYASYNAPPQQPGPSTYSYNPQPQQPPPQFNSPPPQQQQMAPQMAPQMTNGFTGYSNYAPQQEGGSATIPLSGSYYR